MQHFLQHAFAQCPHAPLWGKSQSLWVAGWVVGLVGWLAAKFHGIAVNLWATHTKIFCAFALSNSHTQTNTHTCWQSFVQHPVAHPPVAWWRTLPCGGPAWAGGNWNKCFRDIYLHICIIFRLHFLCGLPLFICSDRHMPNQPLHHPQPHPSQHESSPRNYFSPANIWQHFMSLFLPVSYMIYKTSSYRSPYLCHWASDLSALTQQTHISLMKSKPIVANLSYGVLFPYGFN